MLVTIPDEVAARQLKSAVQLENNIREEYLSNGTQIRQEVRPLSLAVLFSALLLSALLCKQAGTEARLC
jgi:hypothetical protein